MGYNSQCAVDVLLHNVTELNKIGNTFVGVSNNKPFVLDGTNYFRLGRANSHYRLGVPKADLIYNGIKSSIALESLYAFLDEAYKLEKVRETYKGLVGNCMGNQVAQHLPVNYDWIEITEASRNITHGFYWHRCHKAGVNIVFSAYNKKFKEYIDNCRGKLDADYIKKYSSIRKIIFNGLEYWEVQ